MNSLVVEELAKMYPGTSFIHEHPAWTATNIAQGFGPVLKAVANLGYVVLKPWTVGNKESGEIHLFGGLVRIHFFRRVVRRRKLGRGWRRERMR
jgi:hypothetical protein